MPLFVNDTFTDTTGTALTSHTGELGASWTAHPIVGGGLNPGYITNLGRVRCTDLAGSGGAAWFIPSGSPATAEYDVTGVFVLRSTDAVYGGIGGRVDATTKTGYVVLIIPQANAIFLYKYVAGAETHLGTGAVTLALNTPYTLKLELRTGSQKVYFDGTEIISTTDTAITAAGKPVMALQNGTVDPENVGQHFDSFSASDPYTPVPKETKTVDSPGLYWSKQWFKSGSSFVKTTCPGAYLKTKFTGTSFGLVLNTSALASAAVAPAKYPIIKWSVDNGLWQSLTLTPEMNPANVELVSALSPGTHEVEVHVKGTQYDLDRWNTPLSCVRIDGIRLDENEDFEAPTLRSKTALFCGDSITEGINSKGGSFDPASEDATLAFPAQVAAALDWEYAQMGFGSQTFGQAGAGNVPATESAVGYLWSGQAHDMTVYDYIVSFYGTGSISNITKANVLTWLTNLRAAAPLAKVFVILPTSTGNHDTLIQAVSEFGDSNVKVLGPLANTEGMTATSSFSRYYSDTIHPSAEGHARIAAQMTPLLKAALSPSGGEGGVSGVGFSNKLLVSLGTV